MMDIVVTKRLEENEKDRIDRIKAKLEEEHNRPFAPGETHRSFQVSIYDTEDTLIVTRNGEDNLKIHIDKEAQTYQSFYLDEYQDIYERGIDSVLTEMELLLGITKEGSESTRKPEYTGYLVIEGNPADRGRDSLYARFTPSSIELIQYNYLLDEKSKITIEARDLKKLVQKYQDFIEG